MFAHLDLNQIIFSSNAMTAQLTGVSLTLKINGPRERERHWMFVIVDETTCVTGEQTKCAFHTGYVSLRVLSLTSGIVKGPQLLFRMRFYSHQSYLILPSRGCARSDHIHSILSYFLLPQRHRSIGFPRRLCYFSRPKALLQYLTMTPSPSGLNLTFIFRSGRPKQTVCFVRS